MYCIYSCITVQYLCLLREIAQQFLTLSAHDVGGDEEVVNGPLFIVQFVHTELQVGDGRLQLQHIHVADKSTYMYLQLQKSWYMYSTCTHMSCTL